MEKSVVSTDEKGTHQPNKNLMEKFQLYYGWRRVFKTLQNLYKGAFFAKIYLLLHVVNHFALLEVALP